jgi:shikimate dehydrogenase
MSMTATAVVEKHGLDAAPRRVLVGLVGRGIQLSRTPAMHEAEGRCQNLSYIYRLLDTDLAPNGLGGQPINLEGIVSFAEFFGFNGLNVTFPYKQEIISLLDDMSEAAKVLQSVNTVVLRSGRRIGHNTDMWGFQQSFLSELADVPHESVLLLGAGGAGAAVAHALLVSGVQKLLISDIARSRATILAKRLNSHFGKDRASVVSDVAQSAISAAGIVNATPVGMTKMPGLPIDPGLLRPSCWVADIIYFPIETQLLAEARKRGCRTMSGESMAIHQAARAFELFTGKVPNVDRMRAAFSASTEVPVDGGK